MKSSIKLITVSSKGQIVIPEEFRDNLRLKKGSHLVMMKEGDTLFLKKEEAVKNEFSDLLKLADESIQDVWGSKKDDIWNKYLE